jgi:phage N-6-adenine-methyltransferase
MIFELLAKEFQFTLDAAADASNAKCDTFFAKEQNALTKDWGRHTVWLNPPGNEPVEPWIAKAIDAVRHGATVVMLARPGLNTRWFAECISFWEVKFIEATEFKCAECGQHLEFCVVIFRLPGERHEH